MVIAFMIEFIVIWLLFGYWGTASCLAYFATRYESVSLDAKIVGGIMVIMGPLGTLTAAIFLLSVDGGSSLKPFFRPCWNWPFHE